MVKDIWKYESEYQMAKLKLIDKYMIIYDNITDPV